ncbi:putative transcriptional regulator tpeD [Wolffia australiana]
MKIQFAEELTSVDHISLTVDTWTTENDIELLGHSGEKMSDVDMAVLEEFKLTAKVTAITTDKASCNGTMMTLLAEGIVDMNLGFTHACQVPCFAHIINIVIQADLARLHIVEQSLLEEDDTKMTEEHYPTSQTSISLWQVVTRVRESITMVRASTGRSKKYWGICATLGLPNCNKLPLDMPTRWNSTHDMLEVAVEKREALFNMVLVLNPQGQNLHIVEEEWDVITEFVRVLKPFA